MDGFTVRRLSHSATATIVAQQSTTGIQRCGKRYIPSSHVTIRLLRCKGQDSNLYSRVLGTCFRCPSPLDDPYVDPGEGLEPPFAVFKLRNCFRCPTSWTIPEYKTWLAREESNLRYLSEPISETGGFTNVAYTPMVVGLTYQP